jgi:hypothetical protein
MSVAEQVSPKRKVSREAASFSMPTTRKVVMADEVEVTPWLLVHHDRRFWVSPWCMSKHFFLVFEAT